MGVTFPARGRTTTSRVLVGVVTLPFSVVEVFVNAALGLACGGRCRLVTALRELLLRIQRAARPVPP